MHNLLLHIIREQVDTRMHWPNKQIKPSTLLTHTSTTYRNRDKALHDRRSKLTLTSAEPLTVQRYVQQFSSSSSLLLSLILMSPKVQLTYRNCTHHRYNPLAPLVTSYMLCLPNNSNNNTWSYAFRLIYPPVFFAFVHPSADISIITRHRYAFCIILTARNGCGWDWRLELNKK